MDVFWQRGYTATSVEHLSNAMGINRFSLYDTFGDKRDLYVRALDRYIDTVQKELEAPLEQGKGLEAIHAFFANLGDRLAGDMAGKGCFVHNASIEFAIQDPNGYFLAFTEPVEDAGTGS